MNITKKRLSKEPMSLTVNFQASDAFPMNIRFHLPVWKMPMQNCWRKVLSTQKKEKDTLFQMSENSMYSKTNNILFKKKHRISDMIFHIPECPMKGFRIKYFASFRILFWRTMTFWNRWTIKDISPFVCK